MNNHLKRARIFEYIRIICKRYPEAHSRRGFYITYARCLYTNNKEELTELQKIMRVLDYPLYLDVKYL